MLNKRSRRKNGFARTKNYPFKNHPAFYKKLGNDYIEFITFTHSDSVDFPEGKVETKELRVNINYKDSKEKQRKSYVVPKVYESKRSALKNELHDFRVDKVDMPLIEDVFKNSKKQKINYISNSKKHNK